MVSSMYYGPPCNAQSLTPVKVLLNTLFPSRVLAREIRTHGLVECLNRTVFRCGHHYSPEFFHQEWSIFICDGIFRVPKPSPVGLWDMEETKSQQTFRPGGSQGIPFGITIISHENFGVAGSTEHVAARQLQQQ